MRAWPDGRASSARPHSRPSVAVRGPIGCSVSFAHGRPAAGDAGRVLTMAAGFSVQIDDLRAPRPRRSPSCGPTPRACSARAGSGGTGGMAGRDPVLAEWRARYDAMAAAQWAASTTAVSTLGAIATKLSNTADTYLGADHAARIDATPAPLGRCQTRRRRPERRPSQPRGRGRTRTPAPASRPGRPAGPPPSTGPGGPDVPDVLAEYFPGGDPGAVARGGGVLVRAGGRDGPHREHRRRGLPASHRHRRRGRVQRHAHVLGHAVHPVRHRPAVQRRRERGGHAPRRLRGAGRPHRAHPRGRPRRGRRGRRGHGAARAARQAAGQARVEHPRAGAAGRRRARSPSPTSTTRATPTASPSTGSSSACAPRTSSASAGWPCRPPRTRRSGWASPTSARSPRLDLTGTAWDTAAGPHPTPDAIHIDPAAGHPYPHRRQVRRRSCAGRRDPRQDRVPPRLDRRRDRRRSAVASPAIPTVVQRSVVPGRWVATGDRDGRADQGHRRRRRLTVVTAVPLAGPGVVRNPEVGGQQWISSGSRPTRGRSCSTAWVTGCRTTTRRRRSQLPVGRGGRPCGRRAGGRAVPTTNADRRDGARPPARAALRLELDDDDEDARTTRRCTTGTRVMRSLERASGA